MDFNCYSPEKFESINPKDLLAFFSMVTSRNYKDVFLTSWDIVSVEDKMITIEIYFQGTKLYESKPELNFTNKNLKCKIYRAKDFSCANYTII